MQMAMLVFRSSLKDRVHALLHQSGIHAFTEVNETVGYGQTGPAEGLAFYPGTNSVILVALDDTALAGLTQAAKTWCQPPADNPAWQKPSIRIFSWPCDQIV
jgi:hypothetical protein